MIAYAQAKHLEPAKNTTRGYINYTNSTEGTRPPNLHTWRCDIQESPHVRMTWTESLQKRLRACVHSFKAQTLLLHLPGRLCVHRRNETARRCAISQPADSLIMYLMYKRQPIDFLHVRASSYTDAGRFDRLVCKAICVYV